MCKCWHRIAVATVAVSLLVASVALAEDWPMWRHDASRTGASPEQLADQLHLQWSRDLPPPAPAWPKEPYRLGFDISYEPVAMGGTLFVPSMVTDSVTAYDTATGAEKWKFTTDGPVRFAPVAWKDRVAFVSDDGYLYCLDAATGSLVWKVRGLPSDRQDRKVLGNGRLISLWPARGGPVLVGGTLFFGAGLLPFEGVYLYGVDARTGRTVWVNTAIGHIKDGLFDHQQHHGPKGVAGISPHGYLSVVGDRLVVPSGRGGPAFVDPSNGRLDDYSTGWGGRETLAKGSWYVASAGDHWFQSGDMYTIRPRRRVLVDPANAKGLGPFRDMVLTPDAIYFSAEQLGRVNGPRPVLKAYSAIVAWKNAVTKVETRKTANGKYAYPYATIPELWRMPSPLKVHIKAGGRLYAGGPGVVAAVQIPAKGEEPRIAWQTAIRGTPATMLAADGKLFVATREGGLYCFGPARTTPKQYQGPPAPDPAGDAVNGYALVWGVGSGGRTERLARESGMRVIAVDPDPAKVAALRCRLDEEGLYGTRVSVHVGTPATFPFPPYMASLITTDDLAAAGFATDIASVARAYRALRPYGGTLEVPLAGDRQKAFLASVQTGGLDGAQVTVSADAVRVTRGPLPGAADWTHPQADAGKSFVGADTRVRAPLTTLWFGGSMDLLFPDWDYTHSCHPIALVARGRTFIQVRQTLSAGDIYTGRLLWQKNLPPRGSGFYPYAAAGDDVYVVSGAQVLRLSAATGATLGRFRAPKDCPGNWDDIVVAGDALFGRVGEHLVALDRQTGAVRWTHTPTLRLADFAVGDGKVFWLACPRGGRGGKDEVKALLAALDASTGESLWKVPVEAKAGVITRPTVAYSKAHGVIVVNHRAGIAVYKADGGEPLWRRDVPAAKGKPPRAGGYILHRAVFVDTWTGRGFNPQTGADMNYMAWNSTRGCSFAVASEHLMTLRDGHASFFELPSGQRTFLQGFRGGCTPSLIPADGLLVAPNYARGCTCNYAIYTSLGLLPVQDLD